MVIIAVKITIMTLKVRVLQKSRQIKKSKLICDFCSNQDLQIKCNVFLGFFTFWRYRFFRAGHINM